MLFDLFCCRLIVYFLDTGSYFFEMIKEFFLSRFRILDASLAYLKVHGGKTRHLWLCLCPGQNSFSFDYKRSVFFPFLIKKIMGNFLPDQNVSTEP